ncbi:MAG TPA: M3 family oligoendopeptidase [Alphaproteobacteria bacterium]|nr:M3 family oligoendopeptidase [Alphaproteobacteria bacterium]
MTEPHTHKPDRNPAGQAALPRWDLSALFSGKDGNDFKSALDNVATDVADFAKTYRGQIAKLDGAALGQAVQRFETISENISRIETYTELLRAADAGEDGFASKTSEKLRAATKDLIFFELEINKLSEAALIEKMAAQALARYAPWLAGVRAGRNHQLTDEQEKYRHLREATAEDAWRRLFDQTMADMRFTVDGKKLTEAEVLNIVEGDADPAARKRAWEAFAKGLNENIKSFTLITNTLAGLKAAEDEQRGFENPEDSRHLENRIAGETVEALSKAVKDSYGDLSHKYYAWKAQKAGVARLHPADRNAPLEGAPTREIPWDEAKEIVLEAFGKLSPEMEKIGRRFFDEGWIDAEPRAGKDSGAFSHPAVPSAHPYILLNYFGTPGDVMTLAHELGHGIHQVLAGKQGHLMADTPLTVAETASVFGEMLVFQSLLAQETDPVAKRAMIAGKIEDMLNTVVRQTAFYTFEQKLHKAYRDNGELSAEDIGKIWRDVSRESLGAAIHTDVDGAENFWAYIPHFIHTPFYVYAYAFGDCLVNALYDEYSKAPDKQDFVKKYEDLLSAGGSKSHEALLQPFGFDTADPTFWKKGLGLIGRYIDDLIKLDQKIEAAAKAQKDFKEAGADIVTPPAENDNKKTFNAKRAPPRAINDGKPKPPAGGSAP